MCTGPVSVTAARRGAAISGESGPYTAEWSVFRVSVGQEQPWRSGCSGQQCGSCQHQYISRWVQCHTSLCLSRVTTTFSLKVYLSSIPFSNFLTKIMCFLFPCFHTSRTQLTSLT